LRTTRPTTGTEALLAGVLAALLLAGRASAAAPPEGTPVIAIDGEGVSSAEFSDFADALHPDRGERAGITGGEAAEGLVRNRLLADLARHEGIDRKAAVRSRLLSRLSPLWNDLYWQDVVRPTVGDGEAELAAAAPPGEESVTVRQITAPTREAAEEAARLVSSGTDFSEAARLRSTGLTASKGGFVGTVTRRTDRYEPDVVERLFRMAPGDVTPVLPTRTGYAILKVEGKVGADEARRRWMDANRAPFRLRRERAAWDRAREELLAKAGFSLSGETLRRYRTALKGKRSVASLLDLPAARVGKEEIRLRDVVDPAGTGTIHPGEELETMVRSKAEDAAVAREAERLGLPARHPRRARRERFLRENLLAREYLSWRSRKLDATEGEMRDLFRAERERYALPRALDLSFIESRSADRIGKALAELSAGMPFPEVARRWSDGDRKGGRAGFVPEPSLDPSLAPVTRLSPGEHTLRPLEVPAADGSGIYLVVARLNAVRPGRSLAWKEADRQALRASVVARKRADEIRKVLAEASAGRKVELLPALDAAAASAGFASARVTRGGTR
jgi:hypothetical protein